MKKNLILIISAYLIFINTDSFGLSLEDSLTAAYNNNDQIKSNQNNFLLEIEQFSQALSGFMPKISASITTQDQKTKSPGQNLSAKTNRLQKQLSINQPIFNGGSSVAALKAAQSGFRVSRDKYYINEQQILLNVVKAYLNCYAAKEKYEIAIVSLNNLQKQLDAVEEKLRVGESTETEKARAQADLATAEAGKLIAYANLQNANASFFVLTGIDASNVTMPSLPDNLPKEFDELANKARIKNFDLDKARNDAITYKSNEGISKGALLPQVSFSLTAGNVTQSAGNNNPSAKQNSLTTGLSVNIPIYARGGVEYSDIRKAKKNTKIAAIQLDQKIKEINASCISNWQTFESQKLSIKAYEEAVIAAQSAYDGEVQGELVGSKSILDVLLTLEKLNRAKIDRVNGIVQYITSAYELKALTGELTAKSLRLKVNSFSPEDEFKKSKIKLIGF